MLFSLVGSGENTTTIKSGFENVKEVTEVQDGGPVTGNTGQTPPPFNNQL
ncbi:hypothetical protein [Chryseobacterium sp. MYb328]